MGKKNTSHSRVRERKTKTQIVRKLKKTYDADGIEQAILDEGSGKAFIVAPPIISIAATNCLKYPREINACAAARK